jgi:hypothetical protein
VSCILDTKLVYNAETLPINNVFPMITNQRLERILLKLAQQYAPDVLKPGWEEKPNALKQLARALADERLLVIMGNCPAHLNGERDQHIQNWVNAHARFHNLLAQTLFPNYSALEARFADEYAPTVVVIEAQITPMVEAMAGYLIPFIASRQTYTRVPDHEVETVMEAIMARMAANDLSRPIYDVMVRDGMSIIRRLLQIPVQQIALTDFDTRLFAEVPKPRTMPKPTGSLDPAVVQRAQAQASAPPQAVAQPAIQEQPIRQELKIEDLEEVEKSRLTPTDRMFVRPVSLTFERTPPVPPLPKK